jgi:glycosyltransferase involved in cell wall biosynthesis
MIPVDARENRLFRSLWRDRPFLDPSEIFRRVRYGASASPRRLLYLAGTGDALGLFRQELLGVDGRRELAIPYSRQVLEVCESLEAGVLTIVERSEARVVDHGRVRIEEHAIPFNRSSGAVYHFGRLLFAFKIAWIAWCFRPQVVLASTSSHWFALALLSWMNIKIITSLHNSFWPVEHRPLGLVRRAIIRLNGWFWRRHVTGTIAVSEECARQVREIARSSELPIRVIVAQYPNDLPPTQSPPAVGPFRVLFAGRLERTKGVWDVLEAAKRLSVSHEGRFFWTLAGGGGELQALRTAVMDAGLEGSVSVPGNLTPIELIEAIDAHHALVSPTTSGFSEGLQKVALEGMLRGRPVVTTRYSNAFDRFGSALVSCDERNPDSIAQCLVRLAEDANFYEDARAASLRNADVFFDRRLGYAQAVEDMVAPIWAS